MTHTLIADGYKVVGSDFLENPDWEANTEIDSSRGATAEATIAGATGAVLPAPSRPRAPTRSWFAWLAAGLARWLHDCADRYAAAAAYEDLSRLSDAELKHRGLSRDILARDLSGR